MPQPATARDLLESPGTHHSNVQFCTFCRFHYLLPVRCSPPMLPLPFLPAGRCYRVCHCSATAAEPPTVPAPGGASLTHCWVLRRQDEQLAPQRQLPAAPLSHTLNACPSDGTACACTATRQVQRRALSEGSGLHPPQRASSAVASCCCQLSGKLFCKPLFNVLQAALQVKLCRCSGAEVLPPNCCRCGPAAGSGAERRSCLPELLLILGLLPTGWLLN